MFILRIFVQTTERLERSRKHSHQRVSLNFVSMTFNFHFLILLRRPFVCLFCPKAFTNAANCRKHKVKDHAEELKNWEAENGVGGRKLLECYQ